jgi:hypothetical protein
MHENETAVQEIQAACHHLLSEASARLKVLDPELGEQELIKLVAAELARLAPNSQTGAARMAALSQLLQGPGGA